jgi:hypothetical protein
MTAYRKCIEALDNLPHCADITRKYCGRYSGILLVDGKFVKVKGWESKIPVIYGIDFLTHDIPTFLFTVGENFVSFVKFFTSLRLLNYPLRSLVSDENLNIPNACRKIYPKMCWQLCTNHLKENIRASLGVRTNPEHRPFVRSIEHLFKQKISMDNFNRIASGILKDYIHNETYVQILLDIERRKDNLLAFLKVRDTPQTNNLIECFNSHLQGRLDTVKGFESFKHANSWLNGYFLRRRTTKFTDCSGRFKKLNGKTSLQMSLKDGVDLPRIF